MTAFVRLVRLTKVVTFISAAWTLFVCFAIIGWQVWTWRDEGSWPTLLLSDVVDGLRSAGEAIYVTASADESESSGGSSLLDAILTTPAIVPLLAASALIIGFHLWLRRIEQKLEGLG